MKRIGILGGTFNPIHYGHLAVADVVAERFKLDKIIFIPTKYPPHKTHKDIADVKHRFHMVELAVAGNKKFSVSDFEVKKESKSYSIETVRFFKEKLDKHDKLFFIIGSDMLPTLPTWKDIAELRKLTRFIVVKRKDYDISHINSGTEFVADPNLGVSASHIRDEIKKKHSVRYMLPDNVLYYIHQHKLYM